MHNSDTNNEGVMSSSPGLNKFNHVRIKTGVNVNRPLETVALHLTDPSNFKDWAPFLNETEIHIVEYQPFRKISIVEETDNSWIRRTFIFEPLNSHGTHLTYIEEHKLKGLFAVFLGPVLRAVLSQQIKERLARIKCQLEEKKPAPIMASPATDWIYKSVPKFIKYHI